MKNLLNQYFGTKGTISGTAYIFRPILSMVLALVPAFAIGLLETVHEVFGGISLVVYYGLFFWSMIAIMIKRARAMSVEYSTTANVWFCILVPFAGYYYALSSAKVYGGENNTHNG